MNPNSTQSAATAQTALAHELFAAAQLAPGEGIEDAVSRIVAALTASPHPPRVSPEMVDSLERAADTLERLKALGSRVKHLDDTTTQPAAPQGVAYAGLPKDMIRAVFIENGFTVKEGQTDLKQYVYDAANELLRRARLRASNGQAPAGATFQQRVQPWMLECFGAEIAADRVERNHRFLEESLELVQALGCTASEAHQLVDYVFGRPVGDPPQEVGGVMVTLAALCLASGLDMHDAGEVELARISAPELVAKIRAKQAAKPKHSPLPEAPTAQAAPAATDPAYSEACSLATALFEKHYRQEPDYASGRVVWSLCDTTAGVISQIDNMVSGLARAPAAGAVAGPGWKLVPVVVTNEMWQAYKRPSGKSGDWSFAQRYTAMIAAAPTPAAKVDALTQAARDVLAERQRQTCAEGWTPEHDDEHQLGELSQAAACYASQAFGQYGISAFWPWAAKWWKPSQDPRRNLEKAGALILAEMERIDRTAHKQGGA